jgi:PAS domain S-box-containing protein
MNRKDGASAPFVGGPEPGDAAAARVIGSEAGAESRTPPHPGEDFGRLPLSAEILGKWQRILGLLAGVFEVPAAVLLRPEASGGRWAVLGRIGPASFDPDAFWTQLEALYSGPGEVTERIVYAEDTRQLTLWTGAPGVPEPFTSLLGVRLYGPEGKVFGAICVLDDKPVKSDDVYRSTLQAFGSIIEDELRLLGSEGESLKVQGTVLDLTRLQAHLEDLVAERTAELRSEVEARRRVEEELRASEERFKTLFESAPAAYYLSDARGNFLDGNRKAEELTGFSREELIGRSFFDLNLLPTEERPRVVALLAESRRGLKTGPNEIVLNRKDGRQVTMEIMTHPVQIGGQSVVLGVARDISGRKTEETELKRHRDDLESLIRVRTEDLERSRRAALSLMQDATVQRQRAEKALEDLARSEYELIRARDQAEAANTAKSAFLATMSHEIRTPLNAILGLAHLALRTDRETKQTAYLQKIVHSSVSLQRIIDDTLDFSKIEAGRLELEAVDFRLDEVLEDVASLMHAKARGKGLRFLIITEPDVPLGLHGDPTRLRQILLNLADNAVKFTESGQVTVLTGLERSEDGLAVLRFTVRDTGIGLSEKQVGSLFRPFTQADATTTRKYGGTGLGLAICRRLVELMNGKISVKSEPGHGSEFAFTARFGVAPGAVLQAQRARLARQSNRPLAGVRVLLVEDNEINREVGRELLESEGALVEVAENGREAVDKVEPGRFDLVLMDIQMPVMDGLEAVRLIRRNKRLADLPILSMTADVREMGLREYAQAGMNDNISKPIDPDILFDTLARWVRPRSWVLSRGSKPGPGEEPDPGSAGLGDLAGIDAESGLARVSGNVGLYRKLLSKFRNRYEQAASQMRKSVHGSALDQARLLSHTLKGVAGNIGAGDLSQSAGDLQQAIEGGSQDEVRTALAVFSRNITTVMDSIEKLERENAPRPEPSAEHADAPSGSLLGKMLELVRASDLDALDLLAGLKEELGGRLDEGRLTALRDALENFRFDDALEQLTRIADALRKAPSPKE